MGIFKLPRITTTDRSTLTLGLGELVYDTDLDQVFQGDGATAGGIAISSSSGTGDVVGPASAVNNRVVFFDGTTGKLIKDSGLTLSGSNTGDETTSSIKTKLGAATTSSDGYLTSTDWNTFNNKGLKSGTASGTDTYTVSISGVTSYTDGDAYLVRFTNGNTGSCTLNINSLGAKTLYRNNDGALIGGDIVAGGEMLCVYNASGNYFQTIGTAPNTLLSYVTNAESVTITKGQVVYAYGGTGDRMTVKLADNTSDATSAQTVGIVLSASIGANQKGLIINQGLLDGLSILPTSSFADGDTIYLDSTAGGITNVKPYAPNHLVYLGVVTTASNGSAGRMYVRVQNGYELDELHNVQAQSPTANDILYYFGSNQWKTASIPTILGYTPVTNARTISTTSPLSGGGDLSANRTLSIAQATTSASGYLSSTDWNTFNSKEPALTKGNLTESTSSVLTITGGSNAIIGSGLTIEVKQATSSVSGYLSSTDWSTFNGKQAALSGSGIVKSTGGTISYLTDNSTNWDSAYTNRITSLTTTGSSGAATLVSNVLNIPTYTLSGLGGQPLATNLTSLAGLSYASASFVKMTSAGTFSLDTATYLITTGLAGGQTATGGTASGENLTLRSTSNATKGKILFGTSAYDESTNRLGLGTASPSYAAHFVLPTLGTGETAFYLSSSISAASSGIRTMVQWDLTTAGTNTSNIYGFNVNLLAGYTGASATQCGRFINSSAGTGTNLYTGSVNASAAATCNGVTVGTNMGLGGTATNGLINVGNRSIGTGGSTNSSTNIGIVGFGNIGTSTGTSYQIGGFFGLHTATPTFGASAALMCDNADQTSDIFVARDNGTTKVKITDNGNTVLSNAALATNATNGFVYIPTSAGAPTGTPTAYTGTVAMQYDTTNNKLYIYNGAWKSVTLA